MLIDDLNKFQIFNPIQDGGKKAPYQFFPCNLQKCRN